MKLGSTKHWRDAMELVTKERKLNGKAIMEYYEPLYHWLKEENKRNGVPVGWDASATSKFSFLFSAIFYFVNK